MRGTLLPYSQRRSGHSPARLGEQVPATDALHVPVGSGTGPETPLEAGGSTGEPLR